MSIIITTSTGSWYGPFGKIYRVPFYSLYAALRNPFNNDEIPFDASLTFDARSLSALPDPASHVYTFGRAYKRAIHAVVFICPRLRAPGLLHLGRKQQANAIMLIMNFLLFLSFAISVSSKSLMGNTFKRSKDSQFITTSGNTFQLNGQYVLRIQSHTTHSYQSLQGLSNS